MFVIAAGDAFNGINLYGDPKNEGKPWEDANEAAEYADSEFDPNWEIVKIQNPDNSNLAVEREDTYGDPVEVDTEAEIYQPFEMIQPNEVNVNKLVLAAKCALADLIGIMPEFEPSGDREHPGWQTIKELKEALGEA